MPQSKSAKSDGKVRPAKGSPKAKAKTAASKTSKPIALKSAKKTPPSKTKLSPGSAKAEAVKSKITAKAPAPKTGALKKATSAAKTPPVSAKKTPSAPIRKKSMPKPTAQKLSSKTSLESKGQAPAKAAAPHKAPTPKEAAAPKKVAGTKLAPSPKTGLPSEGSKPASKPKASVSQPLPDSSKKVAAIKPTASKAAPKKEVKSPPPAAKVGTGTIIPVPKRQKPMEPTDPWIIQQRDKIYQLRDSILESMHGVAKDTLRSRAEGSEASAFGMHQADAGSDAYDRDFALSLLSQEQDALYEIEEALKRIELGTYGVCEMSGKQIMVARLEALPFARYTVECQAEVERQKKLHKARMPVTSLFGLTEEEAAEGEEEDQTLDSKE